MHSVIFSIEKGGKCNFKFNHNLLGECLWKNVWNLDKKKKQKILEQIWKLNILIYVHVLMVIR